MITTWAAGSLAVRLQLALVVGIEAPHAGARVELGAGVQARRAGLAVRDLAGVTPNLTRSFKVINALFNTLAYNPPGDREEGYLFWLSWANHTGMTVFGNQDAHGPIRRGLVVLSCNTAQLLEAVSALGRPAPRAP